MASPFSLLNIKRWLLSVHRQTVQPFESTHLSSLIHYCQARINEGFLSTVIKYWDPFRHVFRFNNIEICPTMEEFSAILNYPISHDPLFPSQAMLLSSNLALALSISVEQARSWCIGSTINLEPLVQHFSTALPLLDNCAFKALCLCLLAGYLLISDLHSVDLALLHVVQHISSHNPCMIILAETLNGLDDAVRTGTSLLRGSPLLLQVIYHSCATHSFIYFFFFFTFPVHQIWLYERLQLDEVPTVYLYRPEHYRYRKLAKPFPNYEKL